jgi:microcystin-dependent protein
MAEPFLSEIRIMSFGFPPKGWMQCDGQLLPINQNQALFSLLGTTYGGDGRVNFALPDLRGRAAMHFSLSHVQGQRGGEQTHTLTISEMPAHGAATADAKSGNNTTSNPGGAYPANTGGRPMYSAGGSPAAMDPGMVGAVGGNQAHENMQPYLTLNYCIAVQGIFPTAN